jgi:uncharacterized membrane protein YfhO
MSKKKRVQQTQTPTQQQPIKKETRAIAEAAPSTAVSDFFNKYSLYIFLGILVVSAGILFKDFLFGKNVLLFKDIGSDSYNSDYPRLYHLADYWDKYGYPSWAFEQGMGQSIHPFWFDPFTFLLILGGKENLANNIIYIYLAELFVAGSIFYFYLKTLKFSGYTAILGSVLFAFSGYVIIGPTWQLTAFGVEVVYAAFLLFAVEKFISDKQWYYIPIPIAMIACYSPFHLYLYTILLVAYYTLRYAESNEWSFLDWAKGLFLIGFVSLIGVGIGAFMMGSNLLQMIESPRGSGEFALENKFKTQPILALADSVQLQTNFMRLFSTNMMTKNDTYLGWSNYMEAASLYCGILTLITVPQVFHLSSRREKIVYGVTLGICFFILVFPYLRYTLWVFIGDYYRSVGFFIALILLYFNARAIEKIISQRSINSWVLGGTIVFLFLFLFAFFNDQRINTSLRKTISFFIVIYGFLLWLISKPKLQSLGMILVLSLCVFEAVYLSNATVNKRSIATKQEMNEAGLGFNDATKAAVKYIKSIEKSPFYRIDKDYSSGTAIHASTNDSKAQDYFGTRSYSSFNQVNYVHFLKEMGQIPPDNEDFSRWTPGLVNNSFLQSSCGVKYMFSKSPNSASLFSGRGFDSLRTEGDVKIWKNRYAMPLGFCYDKYITENEAKKIGLQNRTWATLRVATTDKTYPQLEQVKLDTTVAPTFEIYQSYINNLKVDTLQITIFKQSQIEGKINLARPKLLFLSIPFDKGWQAKVDGKSVQIEKVHFGLMGIMLDKGQHQVEFSFESPYVRVGAYISIISLIGYLGLLGFIYGQNRRRKPTTENQAENDLV